MNADAIFKLVNCVVVFSVLAISKISNCHTLCHIVLPCHKTAAEGLNQEKHGHQSALSLSTLKRI